MSTELVSTGVKFPDGTIQTTKATAGTGTVTSVTGTAPISSSGGAAPAISITAATTGAAGSMSAADKSKLDGIAANATANAGTVTNVTGTAPISSSGGTAPVISIAAATTGAAGSMSAADKAKLDGLSTGAGLVTYPSVAGKTWIGTASYSTNSQHTSNFNFMVIATDGSCYQLNQYGNGWQAFPSLPTGKTWIATASYSTNPQHTSEVNLMAIATDGSCYQLNQYGNGWQAFPSLP